MSNLPEHTEWLASQIVDIAINIHKKLGPGLLESVYEKCFCYELAKRNITYTRQAVVKLIYDELIIDEGLRIDIFVDQQIIVELKAQENPHPIWQAQLLSHIKLSKIHLGFLINFHVMLMKNGIKRFIW